MKKNYNFDDQSGPPVIKDFDAESAVEYMKHFFESEINTMKKKADEFVVSDQDTMTTAIEMINQAKKLINKVEKERKGIKKPYFDFGKVLDTVANNIKKPLSEIINVLNAKVKPVAMAIQEEEERKARESAEAAKKAAEERRKKEAAGQVVIPDVPAEAPAQAAGGAFKTSEGSAKLETYYEWQVMDFKEVPRKYKKTIIDEDKLDADIQAGIEVKGVKSWKESKLKTRVNRN